LTLQSCLWRALHKESNKNRYRHHEHGCRRATSKSRKAAWQNQCVRPVHLRSLQEPDPEAPTQTLTKRASNKAEKTWTDSTKPPNIATKPNTSQRTKFHHPCQPQTSQPAARASQYRKGASLRDYLTNQAYASPTLACILACKSPKIISVCHSVVVAPPIVLDLRPTWFQLWDAVLWNGQDPSTGDSWQ